MANPLIGQVLGAVFANAMRGRARSGPFGRNAVDSDIDRLGLGAVLGGMLGRGGESGAGRAGPMAGRGTLLALLLPYAMQWVKRNGGVGAVLERFNQKGFGQQAQSWVSTGSNDALRIEEIDEVVGGEELSRVAHKLGVPEQDVAKGFAEIMPELLDQLSPEGQVPPEADDALDAGQLTLEQALASFQPDTHAT